MDERTYVLTNDGELYHYGVKGMKWGVIRQRRNERKIDRLGRKNERLETKQFKAQAKADAYNKKATARSDSDWRYKKAAKLVSRSSNLRKKAHKMDDQTSTKYLRTERKAAKLNHKAAKLRFKAAKKGLVDIKNMDLTTKANKQLLKASGYEYAMKQNNLTIKTLEQRNIKIGEQLLKESLGKDKD